MSRFRTWNGPRAMCRKIRRFPCPNPDTNPVREPVTTTPPAPAVPTGRGRGALPRGRRARDSPTPAGRRSPTTRGVLDDWIEEGFDLEADILPIIRDAHGPGAAGHRSGRGATSPRRSGTRDRHRLARRQASPHRTGLLGRRARRRQRERPRPGRALRPPGSTPASYVPPSAVSNTMRDELLAPRAGDTEAALRRRKSTEPEGDRRCRSPQASSKTASRRRR